MRTKDNDKSNIIFAPLGDRFLAFFVDIFCVYLLRCLYIFMSLSLWLKTPIYNFIKKYELSFGKIDPSNITSVEVNFFLNSPLFKQVLVFVAGIFLVSILYNFICLSSRWSATIGQKLFGIKVVNTNGGVIGCWRSLLRSILIMLPWMFMFIFLFYMRLASFGAVQMFSRNTIILSFVLFLSWYDFIFLTKNRIIFHDYLSCTRVSVVDKDKYINNCTSSGVWNVLFPNFGEIYDSLKETIKAQISKIKKTKTKYRRLKKVKK